MSLNLSVVEKPDEPLLSVIYPVCALDDIVLYAEVDDDLDVFWNGPGGYQGFGFEQEVEVSEQYTGIFNAVASNGGCLSDTAQININPENLLTQEFDVPNIITADDDGVNDYIDMRDYYQGCAFKFTIADRWGITVFSQTEDSAPFLGRDMKGRKLTEGVYFYTLEFDEDFKHGFIHVVK
jgi:hypothetical protein